MREHKTTKTCSENFLHKTLLNIKTCLTVVSKISIWLFNYRGEGWNTIRVSYYKDLIGKNKKEIKSL